jgi:hypothetical protein
MYNQIAPWVVLSWFPIVLVLVRVLGPRRAAAIAILGGYLFLPRFARWEILGTITIEKRHVPGLAFLAAVLLFDRRTLLKARPSWFDLPMLAFAVAPLIGCVAHRFDQPGASADQSFLILAQWAIPYAIGRLYFDDGDGPLRLAGAIAIGGLVYVPICWFETLAGPRWYVSGLFYNIQYYHDMVERLGGYRPEGFLGNGLELAAWMALTTVMAAWLWLSKSGWRPFGLPTWTSAIAALALGATTVACRGVFGYAVLAIGLIAAVVTAAFRTKVLLMVLMLVPPAYIVARATGTWDGRQMSEIARLSHREGTINVRLDAENQLAGETIARDVLFGFGGRAPYWVADSWWVTAFKGGGLVGMIAQYAAFLGPAALVIFDRRRRFPPRSVETGLALFVVVHMIDSLLNTAPIAATPLIGGTLVASYLAGGTRPSRPPGASRGRSEAAGGRRPTASVPIAFAATLVVLAVLEVVGRLPRSTPPGGAPSPAGIPRTGPGRPPS